jgi:hypothetical protein
MKMADLTEELRDVERKYYILKNHMSAGKQIDENTMIAVTMLELSLLQFKRILENQEKQAKENERSTKAGARVYTDELVGTLCKRRFFELPLADKQYIDNLMRKKLGFGYYETQAPSLHF